MPVTTRKISGKYRTVESATGNIAKTSKGNAVDGGGFRSKAKAQRQARAINMNRR